MANRADIPHRIFLTAWFTKAAKKAGISNRELSSGVRQLILGQAQSLGGGVFKKRIKKNMYRAIVLVKSDEYCVYEYLFAKKDRDNIDDNELADFRKLAKVYETLTQDQINRLIEDNFWIEL